MLGVLTIVLAFATLAGVAIHSRRRWLYYRRLSVRLMVAAREVQRRARERADARIVEVEATADDRAYQRILRSRMPAPKPAPRCGP